MLKPVSVVVKVLRDISRICYGKFRESKNLKLVERYGKIDHRR